MVSWASSGRFPDIVFLCVCVDPSAFAVAQEFAKLYFAAAPSSVVNGFIDNQSDFPNFQAQLGCQGFIIFNASHQIIAQKTLPWMQYRDNAFRDVEGRLQSLLHPPTIANPMNAPVGQQVRVTGLTSAVGADLNGQLGEIVGSSENGRWLVKLKSGAKAFRPENLEDADGAPVGMRVKVFGLTSAKGSALNGQFGDVLGSAGNGRYLVKFLDKIMSLRIENLEKVIMEEGIDDKNSVLRVLLVGHAGMDAEHEACIVALKELSQKLSVKALRHARAELVSHFHDEEELLRESAFGISPGSEDTSDATNDFSAFGSHVADHKRIIALADDALDMLSKACETSEGAVPSKAASDLCKAFVEHATMYDSLYEGKLAVNSS